MRRFIRDLFYAMAVGAFMGWAVGVYRGRARERATRRRR